MLSVTQPCDPTALAVIESLADAVLVLDRDGRIRWASPAAHRHALAPGGGIGQSFQTLFHAGDAGRLGAGLAEALAKPGQTIHVDSLALRPAGGRARPAEATLRHLPDTEGIRGLLVTIREIPAGETLPARRPYDRLSRKAAEGAASETEGESEEQLRQVVRLSNIGIFDHNHLTGEFYWSHEHRKIFGWGAEEPVTFESPMGENWRNWIYVHPEDRERTGKGVARAHASDSDGRFDLEYRILHPDGSVHWIATRSQTFFEGEGAARHPVRTVGAVQDVTAQKLAERQLQLTQTSVDKCNIAIYWINADGQVTYANESACQTLGLERRQLVGLHVWEFDPDFEPGAWPDLWRRAQREKRLTVETRHRRSDGTVFPIEAVASYLRVDGEEHLFVFAQDITERRRADLAVRHSEERLKQAMLVYEIGIFEHDHATDGLYCSPEMRKYLGLDPGSKEAVPLSFFGEALHPEDRERTDEALRRAHDPAGDGRYCCQYRIIRGDGSIRWLDARAQTFFEGEGAARKPLRTVGAVADITEARAMDDALKRSLQEKETLLREVHHRVKNNLQIIASLLHFQAKKVQDPAGLAAFADARNRLRSVILVHEKLYQSADLSRVDFRSYLRSLVRDLQNSCGTAGPNVEVRIEADPLALPIEIALPCGMILCELLTNVFKYAFADRRTGRADVSLTATSTRACLEVRDEGVGLPESFDPEHAMSFGWQLVRNLATQIGGTVSVGRAGGTHVTIAFPIPSAGS